MNAEQLRATQAPLKERYRQDPASAMITLRAAGKLGDGITCRVDAAGAARAAASAIVEAGLHPATGGSGAAACSGDMLLQALVACAGVTMQAVATALGIELRGGAITAEGDLDFRGTLGVSREVPVGFKSIRLRFDLDTTASPEQLATLMKLTERYCVVYQTLRQAPEIHLSLHPAAPP